MIDRPSPHLLKRNGILRLFKLWVAQLTICFAFQLSHLSINAAAEENSTESQPLGLDFNQRLVHENSDPSSDKKVFCTEPSSDVLIKQAESLSIAIGTEQVQSAGSMGLRTQTIQILRDGYFRICEAFVNGAMDAETYENVIKSMDEAIYTLESSDISDLDNSNANGDTPMDTQVKAIEKIVETYIEAKKINAVGGANPE